MRPITSIICIFMVAAVLQYAGPAVALAASKSGAVSQNYQASSGVSAGSLVSLLTGSASSVVPANTTNAPNLIGIAAGSTLLELSNGTGSANDVQVAVSGVTPALVSDANGTVQVGDKITVSPVDGVGMKATNPAQVVGTAQAGLADVPTTKKTLNTKDNKSTTVTIGLVPVAVNVSYYSSSTSQGTIASFVPPFVQNLANAIAGRQTPPLNVLLSFLALIFGFTTATIMLYASVRAGTISIGRNPLAERALRRELINVMVAAVGILAVTVVIAYGIIVA